MRFFTADLHFGHANIIRYCNRPFASVDDMNEAMIDRWNITVSPDDSVFILGDLAMGKIEESLSLVPLLNGTKYLLPGNHDRNWMRNKGFERWVPIYLGAGLIDWRDRPFVGAGEALGGVRHSHFPYAPAGEYDERYAEFHPTDTGHWLLHGHVHDAWKIRGRQINVGVDVWDFRPVSELEIINIMKEEHDHDD